MAKNNRFGQAKILTDSELNRIRRRLKTERDRVMFDILRFTGERLRAVCQLMPSDVYIPGEGPREMITFRAETRKASPQGVRKTRQVSIHPQLMETLAAYEVPPGAMWLFPSRINPEKPMTFQGADWILRSAIKQAGLGTKGISSHSFRRTMITRLAEAGVGIKVIQRITGHESLVSVQRYIEVTDDQMKNAISLI